MMPGTPSVTLRDARCSGLVCMSSRHWLLPHEEYSVRRLFGPPPYSRAIAGPARDLGPEGIRLFGAGAGNAVAATIILFAAIVTVLTSSIIAWYLFAVGALIMCLAIFRYAQALRAGKEFRASSPRAGDQR